MKASELMEFLKSLPEDCEINIFIQKINETGAECLPAKIVDLSEPKSNKRVADIFIEEID